MPPETQVMVAAAAMPTTTVVAMEQETIIITEATTEEALTEAIVLIPEAEQLLHPRQVADSPPHPMAMSEAGVIHVIQLVYQLHQARDARLTMVMAITHLPQPDVFRRQADQ